jgi:YggT family protein
MNATDEFILNVAELINTLIHYYIWVVIIAIIVTWLVQFNVLDRRNRVVFAIVDFLFRITEPALRPIRRRMPFFGGIDFSPFILIVLLTLLQMLIRFIARSLVGV